MTTLDLFDVRPMARNSDPATSHAAARSVNDAAHEHRARIVSAMIVRRRPMTIYEIASAANMTHVQVARRMPELEQAGTAKPTGDTVIGPTGRPCRLWALR